MTALLLRFRLLEPITPEASRIEADVRIMVAGPQGNQAIAPAPPSKVGVAYRSNDGRYIVQCRRGGLSVSRMRPYQDWQPFFEETWRAWLAYRQAVNRLSSTPGHFSRSDPRLDSGCSSPILSAQLQPPSHTQCPVLGDRI